MSQPTQRRRFRQWFHDPNSWGISLAFLAIGITVGAITTAIIDEWRIDNIEDENAGLEQENEDLRAQQAPLGVMIATKDDCPDTVDTGSTSLNNVNPMELDEEGRQSEPCIFRWDNPDGLEETSVICPENYICTLEMANNQVLVTPGTGIPHNLLVSAVILRYAPSYPEFDSATGAGWQRDPCRILRHEQNYYTDLDDSDDWLIMPFQFSC